MDNYSFMETKQYTNLLVLEEEKFSFSIELILFSFQHLKHFFWKKLYESGLVLKVLMTFRHLISKPSLGLAPKAFVRDLIPCRFKHPISVILTKKKPCNILAI